jgi:hypothetical protein
VWPACAVLEASNAFADAHGLAEASGAHEAHADDADAPRIRQPAARAWRTSTFFARAAGGRLATVSV